MLVEIVFRESHVFVRLAFGFAAERKCSWYRTTNGLVLPPGYDVVRRDRQHHGRNGGGVCLYVKSNLNFKIRDDLANKDLKLIFVQISNPRSRPFLVGTWYRPPSSALHLFPLFQEIIDKIDTENSELN